MNPAPRNATESTRTRMTLVESQLGRIVSDMESEKRTRAEANRNINERLTKLERIIYLGMGGLGAVQFLSSFIHR